MLAELAALTAWAYLAVLLLVAADAVFPLVPSELAVVSGGVLAAGGQLNLPLLIIAAALGAAIGDALGYTIGRGAGRLGVGRLLHRPGGRRALVWATEQLHRRAIPVLVAGRFVPGGRTVTTLVAGFLRVPRGRFALAAGTAGPVWAAYAGLLGYAAGRAAADRPWLGVLAAFAGLTLLGLAAEALRRLRARSTRRGAPAAAPAHVLAPDRPVPGPSVPRTPAARRVTERPAADAPAA